MRDQTQWWQSEGETVHELLRGTVEAIKGKQASRVADLEFLRTLYGKRPQETFGGDAITDMEGNAPPLPINVIAEVVDSYVATVVRAQTRVVVVPVGGDYQLRRKAEDRTKFHDGVAYETKLRRDSRKIGREAAMVGTGVLKGYHEHGRLQHWVVPIEELWVDELDAIDGAPRCIYQRHYVDRWQLAELFPAKRALIEDSVAGLQGDDRWYGWDPRSDQLLVTEGWHLRSGPNAKDGRHVLSIDNTCLLDDGWVWDRFPFAVCQFEPPLSGFWSQGIVEKLYGVQDAINDIVEQVMANLRQFGKPRIFVERGSRVNPTDFTDGLDAEIIEYTGRPPTIATAIAVPPDAYNAIELWRQAAYQRIGLPDAGSRGDVPAGLESAIALRTASDIKTARHALDGYAWEDWRMDVAELDECVARDLAREGEYSTLYVGRRYGRAEAKRVAWWEPTDGEEYVLRAYPSGQLPETLAGKLSVLGEMEARGILTQDEVMDLLDVPDVDRAVDSRTAGLRAIEYQLDQILSEQRYTPPEPYLPLQLALVKARDAYNLARVDGIEDGRLDMLRQWIDDVEAMMPAPVQAAPPGPPAPEMPAPTPEGGM